MVAIDPGLLRIDPKRKDPSAFGSHWWSDRSRQFRQRADAKWETEINGL